MLDEVPFTGEGTDRTCRAVLPEPPPGVLADVGPMLGVFT